MCWANPDRSKAKSCLGADQALAGIWGQDSQSLLSAHGGGLAHRAYVQPRFRASTPHGPKPIALWPLVPREEGGEAGDPLTLQPTLCPELQTG